MQKVVGSSPIIRSLSFLVKPPQMDFPAGKQAATPESFTVS